MGHFRRSSQTVTLRSVGLSALSRPVTNRSRQGPDGEGLCLSLTENGLGTRLRMLVSKRKRLGGSPARRGCVYLGTFGLFCPAVSDWKFSVRGIAVECKIISPYPKLLHRMRPT